MSEFIVDETQIKIGKDYFWIWVALESDNKTIVGIYIFLSRKKYVLVAEQFLLQNIIKKYGKHPVSSDGGTWYVPACKFLKVKHHINSSHMRKVS